MSSKCGHQINSIIRKGFKGVFGVTACVALSTTIFKQLHVFRWKIAPDPSDHSSGHKIDHIARMSGYPINHRWTVSNMQFFFFFFERLHAIFLVHIVKNMNIYPELSAIASYKWNLLQGWSYTCLAQRNISLTTQMV